MMGVYIHIPFCRSKCFYCGFYSVASAHGINEYVDALCREIELRKDYLTGPVANTLYLGGGTPSFLSIRDLSRLVEKVEKFYSFSSLAERTIEMNPEDITDAKLSELYRLGFNRLSIGVQSFRDDILKQMNRAHSADKAVRALTMAADAGFDNINIDLIIGFPGYTTCMLEEDLKIINDLPISHISIYILSIDSNSVLEKLVKKGKFMPENDDVLAGQYQFISDYLKCTGFEHYEISNFARYGKYSFHNISYWQQKEYIGLGASAHSYNMFSRQWNVSNIKSYINSLNNNNLNFEYEKLNISDRYNEYIMTNLRTMWGVEPAFLQENYPAYWEKFCSGMIHYIESRDAIRYDKYLRLSEKGWLISDMIFRDLFVVE